ncbi:MAG: hypothetical protein J0I07_04750 [Myxococcales bacterium]|nr:hypothetical protein [Myxococcales bacterium]
MRRLDLKPISVLAFVGLSVALGLASCSTETVVVREGPDRPESIFAPPDAEADVGEAGVAFTSYCPSNKCPAGYTTCIDSRFPCDVNLLADRHNCGACGAACPTATNREYYECVDGRCVLQCKQTGGVPTLDCDGFVDNGCESNKNAPNSCGACGVTCTEPDKPCIDRGAGDYGCGCRAPQTLCPGWGCVDTRTHDDNCAGCGNHCPRGDLDPSLHMYYGCSDSRCGAPKCEKDWGNCDDDPANGCETDLRLPENCGSCGNACSEAQACKQDSNFYLKWTCMCSPGMTFCPTGGDSGTCKDLSSDPSNCGGCGVQCSSVCVNGMCRTDCGTSGFADCNGSESDACEVDIRSDPNNCGGCGITCDGIAGQACVQGRCVVEPCDDAVDAGRGPQ